MGLFSVPETVCTVSSFIAANAAKLPNFLRSSAFIFSACQPLGFRAIHPRSTELIRLIEVILRYVASRQRVFENQRRKVRSLRKNTAKSVETVRQEDVVVRLREAVEGIGGAASAAKASGIPASSLSGYLSGDVEPRFTKMARLAAACETSLDWLAFGPSAAATEPPPATEKGSHWLQQAFEHANTTQFPSELLEKNAHFRALVVLILGAQETYLRMNKVPTVSEVLEWIASHYDKFSQMPDGPIGLVPFKDMEN